MWTEAQCRIYRREGESYSSDLRDAEWARLEPMIAPARPGGRPRKTENAGGDERHSLFCCASAAVGESAPESRLLKKSLAFGDEA
jgi:hypothetical protein